MKCKPWIRHFQPTNIQCFSSQFALHPKGPKIEKKNQSRLKCSISLENFRREKSIHTKVFSALKTQVPQQAKNRFGVYQKACFQGKKKGPEKETTYTPKRLPGVCGGPLRIVLVYRFWAPKFHLAWNFQSRPWEFPTKMGGLVGGSLENFNLAWKFQDLEIFQSLGP